VLGPQGTGFFLILIVAFGALLFWVAVAKQVVFRVFAACLAFIPAMAFGIAAVNKYYDYYQTWGAMISDLDGGGAGLPKYSAAGLDGKKLQQDLSRDTNTAEDAVVGASFTVPIVGPKSHLTRDALVYLPPQYFQAAYKHYRFPVIELLHGSPGDPTSWVDVLEVVPTFLGLLASGQAKPAVLVMPNTDGGKQYSLQCLNNPGGIQDMTYVGQEVPAAVEHLVRVQPPGKAWGVAGYSEGGYCAANIALNEPGGYGFAGVLSGYFQPLPSQVPEGSKAGAKPVTEDVFARYPQLRLRNTPSYYILHVPVGLEVPLFWLAAGTADRGDVVAAEDFQQLASTRQVNVPLDLIPGGHTGQVWRTALGPMLTWMTPQLTAEAALATQPTAAKPHPAKPVKPAKPRVAAKPTPARGAPPTKRP
jgi:enterochelin esterase-like enzyme